MRRTLVSLLVLAQVALMAACSALYGADANVVGTHPAMPAPNTSLIPTIHVANAVGWPEGARPDAAPGLSVAAFATGLDHPRWLQLLPNGDMLVAETNAPPRDEDGTGVKAWLAKRLMKRAGAVTTSANRITLLRDTDGDGHADLRTAFLEGLNSPFGMALVGDDLYVANTDAVLRFHYTAGQTRITATGTRLVELPAGQRNHHWTKGLIASIDGSKLYVTVGSNSNVGENGVAAEAGRAAIWEIERSSGQHRIFASGLRNANGMAWEPVTGALWTAVNERDELGNNLVPDFMTSVREGGFYGWPYSYFGQHVDTRVKPQRPDLVASAIAPDYALGAHTASLGLAYSSTNQLAPGFQQGMFIGQHGSWNRKPRSGYKVVFVPFIEGRPTGLPIDVLDGFVNSRGEAYGRPVGVALDKQGALMVADDVGNIVWRVTATTSAR